MGEKEKKPLLPQDKKTLMKLGGIFLLGIALIFISSFFGTSNQSESELQQTTETHTDDSMEEKLARILSEIKGVGDVSVCLYYSSIYNKEYAYNESNTETKQSENGGEKTSITQDKSETKTYFTAGTQNQPVLLKEYAPKPESVLIVAEGAGDISVKEELFSVAQSLLGLPANKISIVQMK